MLFVHICVLFVAQIHLFVFVCTDLLALDSFPDLLVYICLLIVAQIGLLRFVCSDSFRRGE